MIRRRGMIPAARVPTTLALLDQLNATLTAAEHRAGLRDSPVPAWRYSDEHTPDEVTP